MKIEFDEATKKKAVEIWCQRSYDEMIDFLADVANRQLEVMEKPAFAGPKRQNHQAEIAGHLENGFRSRGSYGGNFWHDVAEHAAMIVTSRFVVEPKSEDFNNSGAIEELGQAGVSPPLVEEIDWKSRAEAAEKRAEKAEAAMERVRKDIECALSNDPGPRHKDWNEGYNDSCRDMAANLGFTIVPAVPAQPLKVLRHD